MSICKLVVHTAVAALATLAATSAIAKPPAPPPAPTSGYCSGSPTGPSTLSVNDVQLNSISSDNCYGYVDLDNQNTTSIETAANTLWGGGWTFLVRDDQASNAGALTGAYGGYDFGLTAQNGLVDGSWTLSVSPTEGLPLTIDFMVFLKGATQGAFYLFDDESLGAENDGTFKMTFVQGNGANASAAGLSGLSILVRDLRNCEELNDCDSTPQGIPEPGTMALLGLSLLGLGLARRRSTQVYV